MGLRRPTRSHFETFPRLEKTPAMNPQNPAPDSRPHFVDNRYVLTLDKALCEHLRVLRERHQFVFSLDIATAIFNVPGFDLLADEFCRTPKIRLQLVAHLRLETRR